MAGWKERLSDWAPSWLRTQPKTKKPAEAARARLVKSKPKLDSSRRLEIRQMMAAPVLHRGRVLAARFPNLKVEVSEEVGARTYGLYMIGERLFDSFIFSGEIGKGFGLKAISCLRDLKGRGSVVARTEMAKVVWCHPEEEIRMALIGLITEPRAIKKETRIELLELMARYDPSAPVRTAAEVKLHPEGGLIT